MNTPCMKHPVIFLALFLLTGQVMAATIYVSPLSTACNPASPGSGTIGDPYKSLNYALTHSGSVSCGDTLELRAGTYRNATGAFVDDSTPSAICDDDEANDAGYDGSHAIAPIFKDCTSGNELIIQNYSGEDVVIDGTDTVVDSLTWTQCESSSQCGAVTGLSLAAPSSTYYNQALNVGSARTPQIWLDPANDADPGTRLAWDAGGTTTLPAGTFFSSNSGLTLIVRTADGSSPATHTVKLAVQGGNGAWTPVMFNSASYVTLRKNPSGGHLRVKYGYYNIRIDNTSGAGSSDHIVVDGVDVIAAGGRDYGQAVRIVDGNNCTIKNGLTRDVMAEGIALYGGGPGTDGIQLSNNAIEGYTIYDTGRGWVDGGGNGQDLGMGIIIKNCSSCAARDNIIHATFRSGIQVNISTSCAGVGCSSNGVIIERNTLYDTCHRGNLATYPPTQLYNGDCGAITLRDDNSGTVNDGIVRNNMITGQYAAPSTSPDGAAPAGVQIDGVTGAALVVNNSFNGIGGPCISDTAGPDPAALTIRNNAMGSCSSLGSGCNGQVCDLYINSTTPLPTHSNNTYWAANSGDQVVRINAGAGYTRATATSFEASAVQSNPAFTSSTDLHIGSSSPMKDAGTSTDAPSDDFDKQSRSGSIDIGADEYVSGGGGGGGGGCEPHCKSMPTEVTWRFSPPEFEALIPPATWMRPPNVGKTRAVPPKTLHQIRDIKAAPGCSH